LLVFAARLLPVSPNCVHAVVSSYGAVNLQSRSKVAAISKQGGSKVEAISQQTASNLATNWQQTGSQ